MKRNEIVKKIRFKSLDLSKYTFEEQMEKVKEEDLEFLIAIATERDDQVIEEFWDKFQSSQGLCEKRGISLWRIATGYSKHLEKMKGRPRDGK